MLAMLTRRLTLPPRPFPLLDRELLRLMRELTGGRALARAH